MKKYYFWTISIIFFLAFGTIKESKAAENIMIYQGTLSRTISIQSLKKLATHNQVDGTLKNMLNLTNQKKEEVSKLLNEEFELPIVLTSKLINSQIGTIIISRVSKIIYPNKNRQKSVSIPAIRAGVINGINQGNGKISLLMFLENYPNKNIAVDYSALNKVINKAESMADLVEFFSASPLEKLKSNSKI
tara:strand:+ start:1233 stop:1802 length:570 start_codon:yes stop_codon:yes gene_type:complete